MTLSKQLFDLLFGAAVFQSGFIGLCALAVPNPSNGISDAHFAQPPVSLQDPHGRQSPAHVFRSLAEFVDNNPQLNIDWDAGEMVAGTLWDAQGRKVLEWSGETHTLNLAQFSDKFFE